MSLPAGLRGWAYWGPLPLRWLPRATITATQTPEASVIRSVQAVCGGSPRYTSSRSGFWLAAAPGCTTSGRLYLVLANVPMTLHRIRGVDRRLPLDLWFARRSVLCRHTPRATRRPSSPKQPGEDGTLRVKQTIIMTGAVQLSSRRSRDSRRPVGDGNMFRRLPISPRWLKVRGSADDRHGGSLHNGNGANETGPLRSS